MSGDGQPRRVRFLVRGANEDQCRRNGAQVARSWFGLGDTAAVQIEVGHDVQVIMRDSDTGSKFAGFSVQVTASTTEPPSAMPAARLVETDATDGGVS